MTVGAGVAAAAIVVVVAAIVVVVTGDVAAGEAGDVPVAERASSPPHPTVDATTVAAVAHHPVRTLDVLVDPHRGADGSGRTPGAATRRLAHCPGLDAEDRALLRVVGRAERLPVL